MGNLLMRREEIMKTTMINKILSLLVVMILSITCAFGADIKKDAIIYFDISDYPEIQQSIASGKKLQVLVGHDSWSEGFLLTKVSGSDNLYKTSKLPNWGGCTKLGFMTVDSKWASEGGGVGGRIQYGYTKTDVFNLDSNISGSVTFVGNPLLRINSASVSITYTLMGVGNDWSKGIAFEPNPDNEGEYMLLNQKISNSKDAVKVVPVNNGTKLAYYSDVKDSPCSAKVTKDSDNNIKLPDGTYDFYYKAGKIYITPSPSSIKLVLMGVNNDWTTGIELVPNPDKDGEYMLLEQSINNSKDAIKVVRKNPCGSDFYDTVKESSCSAKVSRDKDNNIKLPTGTYDFYFKESEGIYITPSPSTIKYVLMGVNKDWENGIELKPSDENDYELVLLGQEISKAKDAIKIVKKSPCGDEFYADVKIDSPVPYSGGGTGDNPANIVLEDGIYDFYFDKNTGKIYIGGEITDAQKVFLDPKVGSASTWRDPDETWDKGDARIAVYYFTYDDSKPVGWVTAAKCNSYFYAQIPAGYDGYNWVRIEGDTNDWEHDVNQTDGIKYDAKNTLTKLTGWKQDDHNEIPYSGVCGEDYENIVCENEELVIINDTVFVTINQFVEADPCKYVFNSFEQAFAVLKTKSNICDAEEQFFDDLREDVITLKKHVVMQVVFGPMPYRGTEYVGMSGGHVADASAIFFRNINNSPDAQYSLVVRTADPKGNRAVLLHPVIRRSRNIVFDNIDIMSDSNLRDNALDIDTGEGIDNLEGLSMDYNIVTRPGDEAPSSNITLKNCFLESFGRNCIHVVGIKGFYAENNEFHTHFDYAAAGGVESEESMDVVDWGGTIKFINCRDVKFLRNNSEGTLATSFFIQGCERMLIMNNVFWNQNAVEVKNVHQSGSTVANVRLVSFGEKASELKLQNIGIYYNTFFIKNNDVGDNSYDYFDFFRLGGKEQPVTGNIINNFDPNTIRFQYNNCYSYDDDIKGNNDKQNIEEYAKDHSITDDVKTLLFYLQGIGESTDWCQCFKYNNFWSKYDKNNGNQSSKFEIGKFCEGPYETYNLYQDVVEVTCKTDPSRPGSLVVVGDGLNIGMQVTEDVSLQGADKIFSDRLNPLNEGNTARPRYPVNVNNESLSPYDKINNEPGVIELYTSKIVGSQTTNVVLTSLDLKAANVNLSLVDAQGNDFNNYYDVDKKLPIFRITDDEQNNITSLPTQLKSTPVYVTFIRPANPSDDVVNYEAFLKITPSGNNVPADEKQFVLLIPIHGHYYDKLNKIPGAWTVGAFQQGKVTPVNTIIWHGTASVDWDDRNNWYKTDGTLVTCLDALTEDLTVIIPNKNSEKYITPPAGISRYPLLPNVSSDDKVTERNTKWGTEAVNAGNNLDTKNPKLAHTIDMEYGASIVGVEWLSNKNYAEVKTEFTARRHDWLLVGGVVNPFEEDEEGNLVKDQEGNLKTRPMVSGDYFLNYLPHVYMHSAKITKSKINVDEDSVGWNESFAPLEVEVDPKEVFAIRLPNQYGPKKYPAVVYNRKNNIPVEDQYDGDAPHAYKYTGRFYNQGKVLVYDHLVEETPVLLTNTYPANINAYEFQKEKGTIQIYDYDNKEFRVVGNDEKDAEILSQHGFLFTPGKDRKRLEIDQELLNFTGTGHRSAAEEVYSFRIKTTNYKESVSSEVYISFDELKEDVANYFTDAPKVFNGKQTALAELYVMRYDKKWAGISIPEMTKPIPLGVKVSSNDQKFIFSLAKSNLPYEIFLEDRQEGKTYNLSAGERCVVEDLVVGNCEGRFYLMLSENEEEELPEDGDEITTDAEETESLANGIDIFTQENSIVVSCNSEMELMQVVVSDVAGRHQVYNVSGQYVKLDLPVSTGVYTISVIGDKATRVEKIKLD